MTSTKQVIGVRTDIDDLDLERLLWEQRALVKTWAMRGTLHLLPAAEYPTWIAALRTRRTRITPGWERYHGVTGEELVVVDVEGFKAWMTPSGAEEATKTEMGGAVYLLPGFDPYVLAPISHRTWTIPEGRVDEVSRSAGWISPVLVVDGRIVGTWTYDTGDDGIADIVITPFAKLSKAVMEGARRHLGTRYANILGPETRLTVTPVP